MPFQLVSDFTHANPNAEPAIEQTKEITVKDELGEIVTAEFNANSGTFRGLPILGFPPKPPENADINPQSHGHTNASGESSGSSDSIYGTTGNETRTYTAFKSVSGTENKQKVEDAGEEINAGPAPRSKINKWALFKYSNIAGVSNPDTRDLTPKYNRAVFAGLEQKILNPTARNIITYSQETGGPCFSYSESDFLQCEHYGTISNDYLITLRRFAYPVGDDIMYPKQQGTKGEMVDVSQPDLARAITWMSPALGNDIKEILKFSTKLPWKEETSGLQEASSGDGSRGEVGEAVDSNPLAAAVESGMNGYSSFSAADKRKRGAYDPMSATYPNAVFGPLNIIKKVLAREAGLDFSQEFKLTFHYDLTSYNNTSPKVAFMDTLSNILALTYNTAPFWGGAARYSGNGKTGKPFGDISKLKSGDYAGYFGSIADTLMSMGGNFLDQLKATAGNIGKGEGINKIMGDSSILENIVGGGLMKKLGGPQGGSIIAAFLSGDPTGQWHVTIGNPMNPILVCGNLCLEDSNVSFEGPLGYEGFPTKMKVEITLKPGRPRDKGEIESMFNAGRGRMYLQPDVENAVDLDAIYDVSAYGNKDRRNFTAGFAQKISDMNAG